MIGLAGSLISGWTGELDGEILIPVLRLGFRAENAADLGVGAGSSSTVSVLRGREEEIGEERVEGKGGQVDGRTGNV